MVMEGRWFDPAGSIVFIGNELDEGPYVVNVCIGVKPIDRTEKDADLCI